MRILKKQIIQTGVRDNMAQDHADAKSQFSYRRDLLFNASSHLPTLP